MKIAIIGAGYVGLVTAACLSEFGFDVTCVEREKSKIDQLLAGEVPFYEPGLAKLVTNDKADILATAYAPPAPDFATESRSGSGAGRRKAS